MATQVEMKEMELYKKPNGSLASPTPMDLLQLALTNNAAIDVIERLAALQEKAQARQAELEFTDALNRVQAKIKRVAPDLDNPQTKSKYASYAAIDRVIRPIYTDEGFSLSFSEEDCPKPEHTRFVCFVSRGLHTRMYRKDMPTDGKGPQGGAVMSKTHASGAADSYAKRYLVKDIFNVAIGIDDIDGNAPQDTANTLPDERYVWLKDNIENSANDAELKLAYEGAMKEARAINDQTSARDFQKAKNDRYRSLHAGR